MSRGVSWDKKYPEYDAKRSRIGDNLVRYREAAGIRDRAVAAKRLTVVDRQLNRYESGKNWAPLCFYLAACDLYKITLAQLMGEPVEVPGAGDDD